MAVTLAHGIENHPRYKLFDSQHCVSTLRLNNTLSQIQLIKRARDWLRDNAVNFDVFHGLQGFDITVRPAVYAERLDLPAVVKLAQHRHDLVDKGRIKTLLGVARKRREMLARLSGVISISEAITQELLEIGISESMIARIPNGVDTTEFSPLATQQAKSEARTDLGLPDKPTLVFAGAIIPRKRPHLLVAALAAAVRAGIDAQLILVGPEHNAEYAAQIRSTAVENKVSDRMHWIGFVPSTAPYLRVADIFGLLSEKEGMPNALLEAMATGLPSVVTAISGTTDLVDHAVHGLHCEPTENAVAEAVLHYLADTQSASRAGEAARAKIEQQYSATAIVAAHEQLFRRVMSGEPAAV